MIGGAPPHACRGEERRHAPRREGPAAWVALDDAEALLVKIIEDDRERGRALRVEVRRAVERLRRADAVRNGELSVGAMLTRTKSLLSVKGERTADQAIAVLARVWDQKSTGPLSPMQSEVALLLSEGFMKRGKPNDYRQARLLLSQVTERAQDPYAASLAAALAGLCTQELP